MTRTDLNDGSSVLVMPYDDGLMEKAVTDRIDKRTADTPDPHSGSDGDKQGRSAGPILRFNELFTELGSTYLEAMGLDGFESAKAIQKRRTEIYRNKFPLILPRFTHKCEDCGAEYDNIVDECSTPGCDSTEFREPDPSEKMRAKKFFEKVNREGQSLRDVMQESEADHSRIGVATMVVKWDYTIATGDTTVLGQPVLERGEVVRREPKEILRADPKRLVPVTDEDDRIGGWKWTCPVHRKESLLDGPGECEHCGADLQEVFYVEREHVRSGGAKKYYFDHEVIDWAFFYPRHHGLDGLSPMHHIWSKQAILHWMDVYAGAYYDPNSKKYPNKFMVVHTTNADAWERNFEKSEDEADENLYANKIMVNEYASDSQSTPDLQVVDMMDDELLGQSEQHKKSFKSDIRTQFGVTDVFDSELSDSGGLNNEGLQLEVTDRHVASAQRDLTSGPLDELMKLLGFEDWYAAFIPAQDRDVEALEKAIKVGEDAAGAGLEARLADGEVEVDDGDFEAPEDEGGMGGLFGAKDDPDAEQSDDEDVEGAGIDFSDEELKQAAEYLHDGLEHVVWSEGEEKGDGFWADLDEIPEAVKALIERVIGDGAVFDDFEDVEVPDEVREFLEERLTRPDGWSLTRLSNEFRDQFGVAPEKAEQLVRTETASVLNRATEEAYRDLGATDDAVFRWIGPDDHRTTEACEWLKEQTADGVTMDRLIELQREAQAKFFPGLDRFRRHVVHPNERHTFTEAFPASKADFPGAAGPIKFEVDAVPGGLRVTS